MSESKKSKEALPPLSVGLDEMMESHRAARWLNLTVPVLLERSKGKGAIIPGAWFGVRLVRYHPRTIIAKMANDAGVPVEVIMASMNIKPVKPSEP
jgi:hypothetical protein